MKPLPLECEAGYIDDFLPKAEAEGLFSEIFNEFDVNNRMIPMQDGTVLTAETGHYLFCDAGLTSFDAMPAVWGGRSAWPQSLARVRDRIRLATGVAFQVARSVYYKDGTEKVDFHRDLPAYGSTSRIASLSLGAERNFAFRSLADPDDQFIIRLSSGSLLFMGDGCQDLYEHALLPDEHCHEARLNLTFRKYGWD